MIRLALLTYNESHNLAPLAECLKGIVDDVVILDDEKTTDNTVGTAKGIWYGKCYTYKSRLESFSTERNKLLDYARAGLCDTDYILIMDPDDRVVGSLPPDPLTAPLYFVSYISGTQEWMMPFLIRADQPFYYEGIAHEVFRTGDVPAIHLPHLQVHRFTSGASPERKAWTIDLLEKDLDNPRSVFYLARMYQDAGRFAESMSMFMRRSNMDSPDAPETFYANLMAANTSEPFDHATAELYCRRAIGLNPSHKEPYYLLAHIYNAEKMWDKALEACETGIALPPCTDVMFVDRWIEAIGIFIERHAALEALGMEDLVVSNG